jgi:hypothetical protein
MPRAVDHHVLALFSIAGVLLDVLGGLYLAYDLLGGERGLLRTLTRAWTYSLLFGLTYGLILGPAFGVITGLGLGLALGLEYRDARVSGKRRLGAYAALRGLAIGLGGAVAFDVRFGAAIGAACTLALAATYFLFSAAPSQQHPGQDSPHFRFSTIVSAAIRAAAIGAGALVTSVALGWPGGMLFPLKLALTVLIVGGVVGGVAPIVEWWASRLPPRRLGAFGGVCIFLGLMAQSVPYVVSLLDVPVR